MQKLLLSVMLMLCALQWSYAQVIVKGTVQSDDGETLPGVNVVIEGTSQGTSTDVDGQYSLEVADGNAVLVYSFIGYEQVRIAVGTQSRIDVSMAPMASTLDEVVVIGYGTQQKKDMTSAITTVEAAEIVKTPTNQAMQALQGKVPGLQVVSNGAPGAAPTVRVRGVGTLEGGNSPLYVVDGMFFDDIGFLNTSDIKTISVLKDASASAIYGVRAANGVILIETKSGKRDSPASITYDGYFGVQRAQNVMKMSNSAQFVQYINETGIPADISFIQNAMQRYGRSTVDPNIPNVNTDWYNEVINQNAAIQNHTLGISGGGGGTQYSVGASYFGQDGLMNNTRNEYERFNLRAKVSIDANNWLKVGANVNLSNAVQYVGENSAWFKSYFAVPILPVFDSLNTASPTDYSNAQKLGYRGTQNPFYDLDYSDNRNTTARVLGNFYLDFDLVPDKLSFKTTFNYSYSNLDVRNVDFLYNNGNTDRNSGIRKESNTNLNTIWDNVLTYDDSFGLNNLTVMVGYSYRQEEFSQVWASGLNLDPLPTLDNEELWYVSRAQQDTKEGGDAGSKEYGSSYFSRIAYNYDNKYLLYATFRREGTSKFQQAWGNFPSIGGGWVVSEEDFFNVPKVDFLKIRGSWGKLGNDNVTPSIGAPSLNNVFTAIDDKQVDGNEVITTYDYVDRWETVTQTDVGISANLFDYKLSLEMDYYVRETNDMVVTILLPLIRSSVRRSFGSMKNSGFEFDANWSDNIGSDWTYSVGGNFATLNNEVTGLGGPQYLDAGQAEFRQRSILGESFEAFYGYEVVGVFQNDAEITNSGYTSEFIAGNSLVPGDFFYKDQNDDGVINDLDRTILGSYLPSFTYGFNMNLGYKNFSLSASFQGQNGQSILNRKRGEMIFTTDTNIDADLSTNLWRGEGTSNIYPSAVGLRKPYNQNMSTYFVESGNYFRIQNVQLSYDLVKKGWLNGNMPDVRIYFTAERPLTVFNYNGFNPEVADGIDRQTYPVAAVYTLGLNVKF